MVDYLVHCLDDNIVGWCVEVDLNNLWQDHPKQFLEMKVHTCVCMCMCACICVLEMCVLARTCVCVCMCGRIFVCMCRYMHA